MKNRLIIPLSLVVLSSVLFIGASFANHSLLGKKNGAKFYTGSSITGQWKHPMSAAFRDGGCTFSGAFLSGDHKRPGFSGMFLSGDRLEFSGGFRGGKCNFSGAFLSGDHKKLGFSGSYLNGSSLPIKKAFIKKLASKKTSSKKIK